MYAFNTEAPKHLTYRNWLLDPSLGELTVSEGSALGFVRIATNSAAVERPLSSHEAYRCIESLFKSGRCNWLRPGPATWQTFADLVEHDAQIRANLVPDAWLAALAISNGYSLATADRGFRRYSNLRYFDPADWT